MKMDYYNLKEQRHLMDVAKNQVIYNLFNAYKSFVAGVLGSKYSVTQIQESGIEICREEKWFEPIYRCETSEEIADILRK